jgi:membrane protease YdiL (CAAX protease family)
VTGTPDNGGLTLGADALKRRVILFSPILVVGLGFVLARVTAAIWDTWSWIPVLIYYWGSLILLTAWSGGRESIRRWLQPSRTDRWIWVWRVLALAVPALFLPTAFLWGLASMNGWWVALLWFGLGAINAWIEEGYWRGLLLDAASGWPGWLAVLYSAVCFGTSHPLIFRWQEGGALNGIAGFVGTLIAGVIWGLAYRQTRSLRLPILGHFLQQMLAPPYNVFIQLVALLR